MQLDMAQVYTDFEGLAALRAKARDDQDAALDEVSRQFESLFLQMMLKSMRDASFGGGSGSSDRPGGTATLADRLHPARHRGEARQERQRPGSVVGLGSARCEAGTLVADHTEQYGLKAHRRARPHQEGCQEA